MAVKKVVIKKYENRRLYDSTTSRYVNLDEVADMLRRGKDVQVVDVATGEDITRLILTQIIVEGAKAPDSNFPLDILRQMVVASGRASQESALLYTKAMLDLYRNTYQAMSPALDPFEFLRSAAGNSGMNPENTPSPDIEATEVRDGGNESEVVRGLKQRLSDLEKRVSSIAPGKPSRVRRKGSSARKGHSKR
jgi:polyhydroxyalkanoate synthesis repressor PhaR